MSPEGLDSAVTAGLGGAGGVVLLGAMLKTFWSWFMKTKLSTAADNAEVSVIETLRREVDRLQVIIETQNKKIEDLDNEIQAIQKDGLSKERLMLRLSAVIKASSSNTTDLKDQLLVILDEATQS